MGFRGVAIGLACVAVAGGLTGCGEDEAAEKPLADQIAPQLRYLDPGSSLVGAIDLRYDEQNGERLRELVSRGLKEYRASEEDDAGIPEDFDGALDLAAKESGLSADDDLKPALDGHLVVGTTVEAGDASARFERSEGPTPTATTVFTYRSSGDTVAKVAKKLAGEDGGGKVPGHPEAQSLGGSVALVGDDTIVAVESDGSPEAALRAALDRGKNDRGFPARDLQRAASRAEGDDPFIVATGNLDLAGLAVSADALNRARREVPLLAATTGLSAVVELAEERVTGNLRMDTDGARLEDSDLPVGPPGDVEVPSRDDAIVGGSRNQSVTTAFAARLARSLFADSQFVRAVERTERKLGIDFEKEFLLQFDCPSISVFEGGRSQRFAARSCVADPERMRRLLPRLAPELPAILTGLQRLPSEGLVALLLIAPDAPLTPSFGSLLAAVTLDRLPGGGGAEAGSASSSTSSVACETPGAASPCRGRIAWSSGWSAMRSWSGRTERGYARSPGRRPSGPIARRRASPGRRCASWTARAPKSRPRCSIACLATSSFRRPLGATASTWEPRSRSRIADAPPAAVDSPRHGGSAAGGRPVRLGHRGPARAGRPLARHQRAGVPAPHAGRPRRGRPPPAAGAA